MEEYKVTLTADISGFKNKMKEAQATANSMGKKLQDSLKMDKGLFGDNELTRRMVQTDNNVSKLTVNFEKLSQSMKLTKGSVGGISQDLGKISDESKKVEINTKNIGGSIDKAFTKGLKSVKRLTLGFLGARSAFMLFRKYLGEYERQNEDFANKMQMTTNIITNALAPAFEWFGNILQYVIIGLARVIKFLTGYDILAKTVDNSLKGASKSAKEFNDNLSGLDEISNIQEDSGGLSSGIGSQLKALGDLQDKIAEVDKWFKTNPIGKAIKGLAEFVGQHPWETLLGIGAFLTLKNFIIPALLGSAGIGGLTTAFTTLGVAIAGAITIGLWVNLIQKINEAIDAVNHYHDVLEKGVEQTDKNIKKNQEAIYELQQKIANGTMTPKDWNLYQRLLETTIEDLDLQNKLIKDQASPWEKIFGYSKETQKQLDKNNDLITKYLSTIKQIPKNYKTIIEADLDIDTYRAEQKLKKIFGNIKDLVGKADGGIFAGHWQPITAYAGGGSPTSGEMFVARESGPEMVGTISGHTAVMNNNQIVASVSSGVYEAVMAAMGGQSDRPIVLNVNGKELAKVTYGDFQEESSRRGTNTAIRRV